jgi:RNA polymerase sigma factor (sigma-70 family)
MHTDLFSQSEDEAVGRDTRKDVGRLVAHWDAAHNLARWLLQNELEAEDAVQDAYVRACEYSGSFRGGDGRSWLLAIVRNCCYDRLKKRAGTTHVELDENKQVLCDSDPNPHSALLKQEQISLVVRTLEALPAHLGEVLVFREFEDMSYSEIATFVGIPIGTVMSRLSRARQMLRQLVWVEASAEQTL